MWVSSPCLASTAADPPVFRLGFPSVSVLCPSLGLLCFHWVSGGGVGWQLLPSCLYIVLGALLSLPPADLSLQMNLGFFHGCPVFGAGEGGLAQAVCTVQSVPVTKCVAGGFC